MGVATSITVFMGRAPRGPLGSVDGPVTIFSFQDYTNAFGGLSHDGPISYAVNDFFLNGGSQWAAFYPSDQTLWASLTRSCDAFLADRQRQGAFYSCFVNCDASTNTPADINAGVVNIIVGIAPSVT